jgi:hypothetical protein
MSNNLFIIFTQKELAPLNVRQFLSESFSSEKIIAIYNQEVKRGMTQMNNKFHPDLLIILDSFDLKPNNVEELLKSSIKSKKNVYVIFHTTTPENILNTQKETLRKICNENNKKLFETIEHHNEGNHGADALNKIAGLFNSNSFNVDKYKKALNELLNNPHYIDPILEAKLELLHLCLTPEGAKEVIEDKFPDNLKTEKENFWNEKLSELNPNLFNQKKENESVEEREISSKEEYNKYKDWSVEDLVKALSGDNTTDKKIIFSDCFDSEYITALSALRDTLLSN